MFERDKIFDTLEAIVDEYYERNNGLPITKEQMKKLAYECYYAYISNPENPREVTKKMVKLIEQTVDEE